MLSLAYHSLQIRTRKKFQNDLNKGSSGFMIVGACGLCYSEASQTGSSYLQRPRKWASCAESHHVCSLNRTADKELLIGEGSMRHLLGVL